MHKLSYKKMEVGIMHNNMIYASTTKCPFGVEIGARLIGSTGCTMCNHFKDVDTKKQIVSCNNPKEI